MLMGAALAMMTDAPDPWRRTPALARMVLASEVLYAPCHPPLTTTAAPLPD
ncbi:hypothetical protein OHD17_00260 [Escherichia coli]|uniref:hypothetical protein n=1 Tax=Escherichia coli TaxID=562 RepID=UPI002237DABA|nr:hypothetical protein [Escherichia coli]